MKLPSTTPTVDPQHVKDGFKKHFSESQQAWYFFNDKTGETMWSNEMSNHRIKKTKKHRAVVRVKAGQEKHLWTKNPHQRYSRHCLTQRTSCAPPSSAVVIDKDLNTVFRCAPGSALLEPKGGVKLDDYNPVGNDDPNASFLESVPGSVPELSPDMITLQNLVNDLVDTYDQDVSTASVPGSVPELPPDMGTTLQNLLTALNQQPLDNTVLLPDGRRIGGAKVGIIVPNLEAQFPELHTSVLKLASLWHVSAITQAVIAQRPMKPHSLCLGLHKFTYWPQADNSGYFIMDGHCTLPTGPKLASIHFPDQLRVWAAAKNKAEEEAAAATKKEAVAAADVESGPASDLLKLLNGVPYSMVCPVPIDMQ